MSRSITVGCALVFLVGCTRDTTKQAPSPSATAEPPLSSLGAPPPGFPQPGPRAAAPQPAAPEAAAPPIDGTVAETMDAGGYTYARLDSGAEKIWVAGPVTKLAVGMKITGARGTLMSAFHSSTLDRTFDTIYFVNAFPIAGSPAAAAAPPNSTTPSLPHTRNSAETTAAIEKVDPVAGGQTIAQVFANRAALVDKPVVVRGKVVKVNNQILGHNWLHLQDGTGAAGTNDLTVTTDATVTLGAIVTVRGTLATNRDFGAGYKYDVLVENAAIETK